MIDIRGLAYFVTGRSSNCEQWQRYAEDVLGMMTGRRRAVGSTSRWTSVQFRILVRRGAHALLRVRLGGGPTRQPSSDALVTLEKAGVGFELARRRGLPPARHAGHRLVTDPSGNRHELGWGTCPTASPSSPQGAPRFVTGDMGMGHTVLPSPKFDASVAFFRDVLGFGLSDIFNFRPDPNGPAIRIHFLHCNNARHHSLAIAEYPVPSGCVHVMVEVDSMTEVGRAHDPHDGPRCRSPPPSASTSTTG